MASSIDFVRSSLLNLFKDMSKIKDIDRDVLKDLVETEATSHKNFVKALSTMNKVDMDRFRERVATLIPSSKVKATTAWVEYQKGLNTKTAAIEHAKMFDSLVKAREIHEKMMSDLAGKITKIFPTEIISFQNMKRSQTLFFGTLLQSIILSNWTEYTWTLLSSLVDGSETEIPRYRQDFIIKYNKQITDIVNSTLNNEKASVADSIIKEMNSGKDPSLVVDGAANTSGFFGSVTLIGVLTAMVAAWFLIPAGMHLFRIGIEKLEMISHEKYLKNKEMKEWLEAHVAKLKMELQNVNPNDPQYQKLLKIIDAYDEKIRDLDQKINEYLEV